MRTPSRMRRASSILAIVGGRWGPCRMGEERGREMMHRRQHLHQLPADISIKTM